MSDRPNILVLMTDQHSKNVLGTYGNSIVRTPNLDRLAQDGMRFTNAYCPAPLCIPCRSSFMTTRFPSQNQVWENSHLLNSSIPTWAHYMGMTGYETSLIGRMHFSGADQHHGFEYRRIGEWQSKYPGSPVPLGPPYKAYPSGTLGQSRKVVTTAGHGDTAFKWADQRVIDTACEYLTEKGRGIDPRPFASVVSIWIPHCPFIAPKDLFKYYYNCVDIPEIEPNQPATIERFRRHRDILDLDQERIRIARAAYFGLVELADQMMGQVLDALDRSGLAENTLVIYCSDHGEMAGEHGCWWKSNYYEGSAGVPLIARLPGTVPANTIQPAVCNLTDIGVTAVDIAGGQPIRKTDGRSLWPTLQGNHPTDWLNETYSEFCEAKYTGDTHFASRMIRSENYKCWTYGDAENLPPALFNLDEDPNECNDLASDPKHQDILNNLLGKIHTNWNPETVTKSSVDATADHKIRTQWAKTVRPGGPPQAMGPPPTDIEDNVVLL